MAVKKPADKSLKAHADKAATAKAKAKAFIADNPHASDALVAQETGLAWDQVSEVRESLIKRAT